jgi:hypothetical protein
MTKEFEITITDKTHCPDWFTYSINKQPEEWNNKRGKLFYSPTTGITIKRDMYSMFNSCDKLLWVRGVMDSDRPYVTFTAGSGLVSASKVCKALKEFCEHDGTTFKCNLRVQI